MKSKHMLRPFAHSLGVPACGCSNAKVIFLQSTSKWN